LALLVLGVLAGCRVTAVHVDHGLRPESGAEAAAVVADAARRFGAAFRSERVEVPPGPNLEARARAARFAVLPADVATGHTMDDQAETVLVNLLRGTGPSGIGAMRPGPVHPLLGIRRADTRRVCTEAGLAWAEDPSNEDRRYVRNRVRHELLPLCAEVAGRDPVPLLARLADLVAADAVLLDTLATEALPDPTSARALAAAPEPLAGRAVRQWLRAVGATPPSGGRRGGEPGTGRQPPALADVRRVLSVARGDVTATEVSGGWRVRRTGGRLVAVPPTPTKVSRVTTKDAATATAWSAPAVGPVRVGAEEIAAKVAELGARITADYADDPPLLIGVLKGAMIFMSDLCRAIELPVDVDFMAVASYGSSTRTSGVVRIVKDLDAELTGRRVLVVEDIIDSGLTLSYLRRYLQARRPASVDVCALLVKEGEQRTALDLRYVGFSIPPEFVVGYGLDVAERYRNLRGVHVYLGDPGDGS
jgi:tRNA(Ile)-lysidine synthase